MLGTRVHDPSGLEGYPGSTDGLDMLPVETTVNVEAILSILNPQMMTNDL
jgi:cobyric acid synthase